MDRGAWWTIVHKITRSWMQLKLLSTHHTHTHVKAHFPHMLVKRKDMVMMK